MKRLLVLLAVLLPNCLWAANPYLYTDLQGWPLLNQLRTDYKPSSVLPYETAKDQIFTMHRNGNKVYGYYSGAYYIYNKSLDPSTDAWNNGYSTEHVWPQSMGADDGPPQSNMHHLIPAKQTVNALRSNCWYGDVPADSVTHWIKDNTVQDTAPPEAEQGEWSKFNENDCVFEPRDDIKGNIARAMFYFFTMYRDSTAFAADTLAPFMFRTLIAWNNIDPVDDYENYIHWKVVMVQSGKENPFILDETLGYRVFNSITESTPGEAEYTGPLVIRDRIAFDTTFAIAPGPIVIPDSLGLNVYNVSGVDWVIQKPNGDPTDSVYVLAEHTYDGENYFPLTREPIFYQGQIKDVLTNWFQLKSMYMRLWFLFDSTADSMNVQAYGR